MWKYHCELEVRLRAAGGGGGGRSSLYPESWSDALIGRTYDEMRKRK